MRSAFATPRRWVPWSLLAIAGACPAIAAPAGSIAELVPGAMRDFDVVLVTLDTTRADRLGAYGHAAAETPNLDRLAREGWRFDAAIAAAPITLPSHASILTGLYPARHGVRGNGEYRLAAGPATVAERLAGRGYETAAFVSAFVLDRRYGLARGFDTYDDRVAPPADGSFPSGTVERGAGAVTDAAVSWLGSRNRERPFFLWVHYFDAHAPYLPPSPFAERFAGSLYDGEIAYVDRELGRLIAAVAARGRSARTLWIVTADHGESLGDHGESSHGVFVYDATMRVPLLLSAPATLRRGTVISDRVVASVDLAPTLFDLLAIEAPPRLDGVSLLDPRSADRSRAILLESLMPFDDYGWSPLFAVRTIREKLIRAPARELYDLVADAGELRNRLATEDDAARASASRLEAELAAIDLGWSRDDPPPSGELDAETRAKLTALGYLRGAGRAEGDRSRPLADPKEMIGVAVDLQSANGLLASGQPQAALELVRRALARGTDDRSALQAAGKILLRLGRIGEAERAFRRFTEIRPKADVSLLLAQIAILDGRTDEAEALLAQAGALDPEHGGVWIARGDLAARRGDGAAARRAYEEGARRDPYRAKGLAEQRLAALSASGE